ncbi:MAG TPA: biotin/lipoyl-containing protein [Vicinamibacterales bacterium]|nr:biotin/lipoyl-containing protein [Vicinamibacterales bacterium]
MRLEFEVEGVVRTVQVRQQGGHLLVLVDGREHVVDAVEVEPGRWSLLVGSARRSIEARVRSDRQGGWTVFLEGDSLPIALADRRRAGSPSAPAARSTSGRGDARITAPMPGKVVRVLVAPGDLVSARQAVIVVEAMKMENELRSPRDGTVREVLAHEGALVEAGAPLLTIG